MDSKVEELGKNTALKVCGGNICSNAFEISYGIIGGSLGLIFGPAGGFAGFSAGYSAGSILAEVACDGTDESGE